MGGGRRSTSKPGSPPVPWPPTLAVAQSLALFPRPPYARKEYRRRDEQGVRGLLLFPNLSFLKNTTIRQRARAGGRRVACAVTDLRAFVRLSDLV